MQEPTLFDLPTKVNSIYNNNILLYPSHEDCDIVPTIYIGEIKAHAMGM